MPFRDRMRKAFGRTPSETQHSAQEVVPKRTKAQRANVYRIGDPMPPPKYPGKYDKPHQDLLRAFSFANAFSRRRSDQTDISPMNSRWASRKNSEVAGGGRRSVGHGPTDVSRDIIADGDTDDEVANGDLSRPGTAERPQRRNAYVVGVDDVDVDGTLADHRTSESSAYYTADESYVDHDDPLQESDDTK